jgi:hypothetical protein
VRSASARAGSGGAPRDVFEDRVVQLRPGHAEDVNQHRPVGRSEEVGVVQVAPAPPGRRPPVFRIDPLRCPAYLLKTPDRPPWPATARRTARRPDDPRERRTPGRPPNRRLPGRRPARSSAATDCRRTRGTGPQMPNMPGQTGIPARRGFPPETAAPRPSRPPRRAPTPLWPARPGPPPATPRSLPVTTCGDLGWPSATPAPTGGPRFAEPLVT